MIDFKAHEEPVHHITVTRGKDETHYWYFLADPESKPFDKVRDKKLVELLHTEGEKLTIGSRIPLTSEAGHKYTLYRLDAQNYAVQSLSRADA